MTGYMQDAARAMQENEELRKEIGRLRDALSFYADTSKYPAPLTGGLGELYFDCGSVAKEALK